MFKSRKVRAVLAGLLGTALLAAGCGGAQPDAQGNGEENVLTLYTSFGADLYNPIAEAFTADTGIQVDIVFGGTGEMLKKIEAEQADPQGDVMLGGGAESFQAYRDLFEPYQSKEDAAIPEAFKAEDRTWYGYNALPMVVMYNKNLVAEDEVPTGWADLADPRWKGQIAMSDATKSGTAFVQVLTMLTIFGRDDGQGWEMVRNVVANAKVLGSSSLPPKGVADGEYALALTQENAALKYVKAGSPVGYVYPTEGTATIPDSVALIKGAHHPENAKIFIDWLLSKEGQAEAAKLGLRPTRTDVDPPEGLKPADEITFVSLDVPWAVANRDAMLSTWKEILTSQ